jgi:hypothetical protein
MYWVDIVCLTDAHEARKAIEAWTAIITTPAEAVEVIGAKATRELSANDWHAPVDVPFLYAWRERVLSRAFIRWEIAARARLVEDVLRDAARQIEERLALHGIRPMYRGGRDMLRAALTGEGERE